MSDKCITCSHIGIMYCHNCIHYDEGNSIHYDSNSIDELHDQINNKISKLKQVIVNHEKED